MISYAWSSAIPAEQAEELAGLIADAIEYDAEAGFSTADPHRPAAAGAELRHLLVTMPPRGQRESPHLDRLPDVGVVAYLRLEVMDGEGAATYVVRPEFRSLGVSTLLMERLLAEPTGWAAVNGLRNVRAWSHSAHPAAERMSWRFGAEVDREVFKTLRFIGGRHPYEPTLPEVPTRESVDGAGRFAPNHDLGIAPADQAMRDRVDARLTLRGHIVDVGAGVPGEFEAPALIAPHWSAVGSAGDKDEIRLLLDAALVEAQGRGARLASLYVDAADELVLHVSREIEFFHDQTDRLYVLTVSTG